MVSVRFVRMWAGFDPEQNPLIPVIQLAFNEQVSIDVSPRSIVDVEVTSTYPSRLSTYRNWARAAAARLGRGASDSRTFFLDPPKSANARLGIWYSPENVRPPASGWDISLSFDATGFVDSNVHLPYWQLGTDLFGGDHPGFLGRTLTIEELVSTRRGDAGSRPRFCCAFIRNPHPVRMRALEALREVGPVDVFGLAGGGPVEDKLSIARHYRFMLCFENDLYPGYVTEKAFDAWAAGSIPLWWGIDRERWLNPRALLNLNDYTGIDSFVERVRQLDRDSTWLDETSSEALLRRRPTAESTIRLIRDAWRALNP